MAFLCACCFTATAAKLPADCAGCAGCKECDKRKVLFEIAAATAPKPDEPFEELRARLEVDLLPAYAAHFETAKGGMRLHVLRGLIFARAMAGLFEEAAEVSVNRFALFNAVSLHQLGKLKKRKKESATLDLALQLTPGTGLVKPASGSWKAFSATCAVSYLKALGADGEASAGVGQLLSPTPVPSLEQQILRDAFRLDRLRPGYTLGFDLERDLLYPGPYGTEAMTEQRETLAAEAKLFIERTEPLAASDEWRASKGDCLQVIEDLLLTWCDELPLLFENYFVEPAAGAPPGHVAIVMQIEETEGEPLAGYQFEIKSGDGIFTGSLTEDGLLTTTVPLGTGKASLALWLTDRGGAREFDLDLAALAVPVR